MKKLRNIVAPALVVGGRVAMGHGGDGLGVQVIEVVELVEGVHIQLPAETGCHFF